MERKAGFLKKPTAHLPYGQNEYDSRTTRDLEERRIPLR